MLDDRSRALTTSIAPRVEPSPDSSGEGPDVERRIEDWIACNLDDRGPEERARSRFLSLDDLPIRRVLPAGPARAASPDPSSNRWSRFRTANCRGVTIVRLVDASLVREALILELADELAALIDAGIRRIVLDFGRVERFSSLAVASLVEAYRRCTAVLDGMLRICGLQPQLAEAFTILGVYPGIEAFPDEQAAVESPWPGTAAAPALPVTILSAMTGTILRSAEGGETRLTPHQPLTTLDRAEDRGTGRPPGRNGVELIVQRQDRGAGEQVIPVVVPRFLIGREEGCDLFVDDATVSRLHARIERREGRTYVRDLGSTNGTVLNGRPIRAEEAELSDGDRLAIGPASIVVAIAGAAVGGLDDLVVGWVTDEAAPDEADDPLLAPSPEEPSALDGMETLDLGTPDGCLKCEVLQDILLLTPLSSHLDEESAIEPLREALNDLLARPLPRRVVVNLARVSRLSSQAIGVLVAHELRLRRAGGALRFAEAQPGVASYLEQIRLPMVIELHPILEDAVLAPWA